MIEHRLRTVDVVPGQTDERNAAYVLDVLRDGGSGCLEGRYGAFVTAPVHKSVICAGGYEFSGHTEFLAELCGVEQPVMLLTRNDAARCISDDASAVTQSSGRDHGRAHQPRCARPGQRSPRPLRYRRADASSCWA